MNGFETQPLGWVLLGMAVVMAIMITQMRRAMADVAAQRLGHTMGAFAGLGASLLVYGLASDRLDNAAVWLAGLFGLAAIGLSIVLGRLGADWALRTSQQARSTDEPHAPRMHLEPGQRVLWNSTLSSNWLLIPAALMMLTGLAMLWVDEVPLWIPPLCFLVALLILALSSISVSADASGLQVKYGMLPWPRTKIDVDQIATASVIDVRPMEWGGWGYRGALSLMRQAAVVLRAGPGIRLDLHDGRIFVVTVDQPEPGVALLNAEVDRLTV